MQPSTPKKFNILVAALKTPSDPSRGPSGNPTVSRTGFTLQQIVLPNATARIGGPTAIIPPPTAFNHTVAIECGVGEYWNLIAGVASTGVLTFGGAPVNGETVTIDGKIYTFRAIINGASLDGDVLNDVVAVNALSNLVAAIILGAGGGVLYALAMTVHPTVTAALGMPVTMVATAKVPGVAGDAIATTSTVTLGVWGAVTLQNGVDVVPPPFLYKEEIALFDQYITAGEEFGAGLGFNVGPAAAIATQLALSLNSYSDIKAAAVGNSVYITSHRPDATLPIKATCDESVFFGAPPFVIYAFNGVLMSVGPEYRQTFFITKSRKTQTPPVSLP